VVTVDREPALDRRTIRRIQRILARTTGKKRVAGIQVAVRLADGQTWLGDAGSAAYAPQRAIEDDTVFAIASVTKTFIAALIVQLAEQGKLDLDAPYGRYVSEGPRRERVTIRQLLSHTSGIYDYFANPRYQRISTAWLRTRPQTGLASREHVWTDDEIMDLVKPVSICKPGHCYQYSNTNYVLLGRVAEAVGGAPLDRLLRRRFFRPLGLEDTYYQPAEEPPADAAHGHWPNGSGYTDHTRDDPLRPFTAAVTAAGAAGAIASTAHDLTIWADALYGGKLLSRASTAQMMAIRPEGGYGLGTDYAVFAGHPAVGHRGGLRGFEASMWYFPEDDVSIVILSNQGNWFTSPARSIDIPMSGIARAVLGPRH
jgi:D-alanyl-D-alanine carboxypeptidase